MRNLNEIYEIIEKYKNLEKLITEKIYILKSLYNEKYNIRNVEKIIILTDEILVSDDIDDFIFPIEYLILSEDQLKETIRKKKEKENARNQEIKMNNQRIIEKLEFEHYKK